MDPLLKVFQPNGVTIPRRGADSLKTQYANLKSEFTLAFNRWGASGQMDPTTFLNFIHPHRSDATEEELRPRMFLVYMFKVIGPNPTVLQEMLRTMPEESRLDSSNLNVAQLSRMIAGGTGRGVTRTGTTSTSTSSTSTGTRGGNVHMNNLERMVAAMERASGAEETVSNELSTLYGVRCKCDSAMDKLEDEIHDLNEDFEGQSDPESEEAQRIARKLSRKRKLLQDEERAMEVTEQRIALLQSQREQQEQAPQENQDREQTWHVLNYETPRAVNN
jgi:chromosome segregation ATPase